MIQDLHAHTYYSFCGKDRPEAVVEAAIAGGIELLGICDHNYGVGYGRLSLMNAYAAIPGHSEADYSRREPNPVAVRRALFGAFIGFLLGVRRHALVEEPVKSLENSSPTDACSFCRGDLPLGKAATVSILSYGHRQ